MKILSYEAQLGDGDLRFARIDFDRINLIVGNSAVGKTRLLNSIFNMALIVTQKQPWRGWWELVFEQRNKVYRWSIETVKGDGQQTKVRNEIIVERSPNGHERVIVERDTKSFTFDGKSLPKLPEGESSITILRDDVSIKPLYLGLSAIVRRNFSGPDLDISVSHQQVVEGMLKQINQKTKIDDLYFWGVSNFSLNVRLYILAQYFKPIYRRICSEFKNLFPFVSTVGIVFAKEFGLQYPGVVPIFAMKEARGKERWISLDQFSSGMRKVLLILTDILTMPEGGGVYLIDEYENSLGSNAINFFPSILFESEVDNQFVITSHHPYIIGRIPVENWIVLHRKGRDVTAREGEELRAVYGKSKQKAFTQLISDPFYTEGIE